MKTKRIITLALIVVMLMAAIPAGAPALASLTPSGWAAPEMTSANTSGLLTPSAARDFHNALTRDEFCELVVVMVEQTLGRALPVPANNPFVDDREPISIHALKAWNYGIITGITTTLFAPSQKVERQQLCAMMIRAIRGLESDLRMTLLSPGIATLPYRDAAQIRDYAIEPVKLAYSNVIMQGNEQGMFMPSNDITSQECVAVIIRSFNRIEAARTPGMSSSQLIDLAVNRVHIGYAYGDNEFGVTQNVTLPTTSTGGATVSWSSSNSSVISISGTTGNVNTSSAPRSVTLTATIRQGSSTRTKTFELTTSQTTGDRLLLDNAVNELDILYINEGDGDGNITGRIGLPTTVLGLPVTWQSSNASIVSTAGIVAVPSGSETRSVTLTATIRSGSQSRTKTFNLTVANPAYSRGVTLHGVQLGMTSAQTTQVLGTVRRSISAANNETWHLYHGTNYSNFIAVAFIGDRAVAVYSMASGAANQLRNRAGSVISVAEANSTSGVNAVSYTDPGNSSQQYAIMIYDSATAIGTYRTMLAEGQEQFLFELVNAFRQRNNRSTIEWSAKLGTATRAYSAANGTGATLQQRVISAGFDSARYTGGNIIPGNGDAIDALDQIVGNSTGSSSMRTAILNSNVTVFGAGFNSTNSGSYRTYFSYALGNVTYITGVTARQNNSNVSTVNVSTGNANAMDITLILSPTNFNESITVTSSNTNVMTVSNFTSNTNGGVVRVTGVANGSANIVVTGNSSGKSFNVPVSVGAVYADRLTLTYSGTGTATTISTSPSVAVNTNDNKTGTKTLVMGIGEKITIAAATTPGATVEWTRASGNAATVARDTTTNDGVVTATNNPGSITLTARVRTGSGNYYITHTITVYVVRVEAITLAPSTALVSVGSDVTASVVVNNLPTSGTGFTPVYAWSASGDFLTRTTPATETTTATFKGSKQGTPRITFTATWSGSGSNQYLGRITKTADVTVQGQPYVDSITLSRTDGVAISSGRINMIPGQTLELRATIAPATITQGYTIIWDSDDTDFVTVPASNANTQTITAVANGNATISVTVKHADGLLRQVELIINVGVFPTITINRTDTTPAPITIGDFLEFSCTTNSGGIHDLQKYGYGVKWTYTGEGVGGYSNTSGDDCTLVIIGTGHYDIIADLYYKDQGNVVRTAEYHVNVD